MSSPVYCCTLSLGVLLGRLPARRGGIRTPPEIAQAERLYNGR